MKWYNCFVIYTEPGFRDKYGPMLRERRRELIAGAAILSVVLSGIIFSVYDGSWEWKNNNYQPTGSTSSDLKQFGLWELTKSLSEKATGFYPVDSHR